MNEPNKETQKTFGGDERDKLDGNIVANKGASYEGEERGASKCIMN